MKQSRTEFKMSLETLFISRDLKADSLFHSFAKQEGLELEAQSLLEFTPVYFSQLPETDWLFFYSPNGVRFFFRQMIALEQKVNTPIATIGLGTLNALKEFGKSADFAGNGHPDQVAEAFASLAQNQRILFVRAQQSRKSIQQQIAHRVEVLDLVVYSNSIKKEVVLPKADYLIFTSPLNVQAYNQNYDLQNNKAIIAIGRTTAEALRQVGATNVIVAKEPSENAMIYALREVLGK